MTEGTPTPKAAERREQRERFRFAVRTRESREHPTWNEDAYLADDELGLAAIFDGLGGQNGGKEAAQAARDSVRDSIAAWEDVTDEDVEDGMVTSSLKSALTGAGKAVVSRGHAMYLDAPDEVKRTWKDPETTASVVKLHTFEDGRLMAFIANIGDSRVYVRRGDGTVEQVTVDHDILGDPDYVHALEDKFQRQISEADITQYRALLDDAEGEAAMPDELGKTLFKMRNGMRGALGLGDSLPPRTYQVLLSPGDILFITSDGVHDNLRRERIDSIAAAARNGDELVDRLTHEAHAYAQAGPSREELKEMAKQELPLPRTKGDDITALAVEVVAS